MTAAFTIPPPTLRFEDAGNGAAVLEKPVTVLLGLVVLESGAPVTPTGLTGFGYLVQRRVAQAALPEVWDDGTKKWVPDQAGAQTAKPVGLTYRPGDPNPWQGLLVAAGMTDVAGKPAFAKAVNGYPVYSLRGAFAVKDGSLGSGPQSAGVTFAGAADRNLFVVGPADGEQPEQATQSRLLLKNTGQQVIGELSISRDTPGASIRLANTGGASIVLNPDGSIELHPATGKHVVIAGDLETDHVRYLPIGGEFKRDLA